MGAMANIDDWRPKPHEMKAWLETLASGVDDTRKQVEFRAALDAMARFWRYSPANAWFILRQFPLATRVAGRRTWERLGRRVRPEATPIQILAPTSGRGFPFRMVEVFDVRQTRGRKLPTLDLQLRGSTPYAKRLEVAAHRLGIVVGVDVDSRRQGVSFGGEIRIRSGLGSRERAAVLSHELAHELLHHQRDRRRPRSTLTRAERETEAEATAYVVMRALTLESTAPIYIAWQHGDGAMILRSLRRIQRAARAIIDAASNRPCRRTSVPATIGRPAE